MLSGAGRPMLRLSIALLVAFVVVSILTAPRAARVSAVTGTVVQWDGGQAIAVARNREDVNPYPITLRNAVYEGDPGAIRPGVRVTVWYQMIGERYPVAGRVRVHANAPRP